MKIKNREDYENAKTEIFCLEEDIKQYLSKMQAELEQKLDGRYGDGYMADDSGFGKILVGQLADFLPKPLEDYDTYEKRAILDIVNDGIYNYVRDTDEIWCNDGEFIFIDYVNKHVGFSTMRWNERVPFTDDKDARNKIEVMLKEHGHYPNIVAIFHEQDDYHLVDWDKFGKD